MKMLMRTDKNKKWDVVESNSYKAETALPMCSGFGLNKCVQCGKMVMGYEKERHQAEVHEGQGVEWKRLK